MNVRLLGLSAALMLMPVSGLLAQGPDNLLLPPNVAPDRDSPSGLMEGELDPPITDDEADDPDKPPAYEYPQRHMFEQPLFVGPDQLRLYNGYWQPGGYQVRDGSPFFNSVPGAPPRGPIAGGGGDSSFNPAAGAGMAQGGFAPGGNGQGGFAQGAPQQGMLPGYGMMSQSPEMYGQPLAQAPGFGGGYAPGFSGQFGMDPNAGMNGFGGGMGGPGAGGSGAGGPGGDPYGYHFGPGYYRNSEYGHFRFPYYSYRRPWFHPGFAGYNRDTNIPW